MATLLQHEAQYPTQEMMLEFVCRSGLPQLMFYSRIIIRASYRFLLYSSKRNMKAHKVCGFPFF